ncbi:MAG: urease accessory protein UreD [Opitutaceae bacterium]
MSEFSGHLRLRAAVRDHRRTVLAAQSFRAPFHLSKPYWDADAQVLLVQVVNPTAGILAGDKLESEIVVESGAALLVTTPSASRLFQMRGGAAECRQHFQIDAGAWLELMPEPLVPHRGSCYRQITTIDVAAGGGLFCVDQLMPGRVAHQEAWLWERLRLETNIRIGGELILRERFDQSGDELRGLADLAASGPTACFANAFLICPKTPGDTPSWKNQLAALHAGGLWVGVSALRRGGWSLKLVAPDTLQLRQGLRQARRILAAHFPQLSCDPRKL